MKRIALLFLVMVGISTSGKCGKCDTIDFYWVYYNDTVWEKMNQNMNGYQLMLDTKKIRNNDRITINYGTDTPCPDCWDSILVEDNKQHVYLKKGGKYGSNITFSVNEMLKISTANQIKNLYFYYVSDQPRRALLFKLKLN